jgi:mutual gliding-motility protein MglA
MALLNHVTREITAKIVYYGPGLCGKTSNLTYIYENLDDDGRGNMLSLATQADRTLFFDFLPMEIGSIRGFKARVQLYTVPGQVYYEETRKRVLKGSDGVVFVADSQRQMRDANRESFAQLRQHLSENGLDLAAIPLVLQYNKRDLTDLLSVEELDADLNPGNSPFFEAVANEGIGVEDTLKAIIRIVLKNLMNRGVIRTEDEAPQEEAAPPTPAAAPSLPAEAPLPFLAEEVDQELVSASAPDPFAEGDLFGAAAESAPEVPAAPGTGRADPEWLFAEAGEETSSLLKQEAVFDAVVDPVALPAAEAEASDPPEDHPALELEEVPLSQGLTLSPEAVPAIHLTPGQPYEADLVVGGKKFRLKIQLEPVN